MKLCQQHWDMLREGVKSRGLWHLVHKSGEAAAESIARQLKGQDDVKDYDPLMAANFNITGRALQMGGLYLMTEKEGGGEYCPVCEVMLHCAGMPMKEGGEPATAEQIEKYWIDGPLDAELEACRGKGLVPVSQ